MHRWKRVSEIQSNKGTSADRQHSHLHKVHSFSRQPINIAKYGPSAKYRAHKLMVDNVSTTKGGSNATDRHTLLLTRLGFSHLLDGPRIDCFQARLLFLHFLLSNGRWRPAFTSGLSIPGVKQHNHYASLTQKCVLLKDLQDRITTVSRKTICPRAWSFAWCALG